MHRKNTYTRFYDEGTLIIDIFDQKSNEHVFRSIAQAEVHKNLKTEERVTRLNATVDVMLEKIRSKK